MDTVWQELIRAVPWGAVIVILRLIDVRASAEAQKERDVNAKEKSAADRETAHIVAKAYADAINTLARSVADSAARHETSMKEFKEAVLEQYKNMGITQDLLDVAMGKVKKRREQ